MDKNIKLRRNIYIILLCILIFGIVSQVTRSDYMLKYVSHDSERLLSQWEKIEYKDSVSLVAEQANEQTHCMIINSEDELSQQYYKNFEEVYRYLKQPYTLQDTAITEPSYDNCQAVIMIASIENISSSIDALEQYIYNGGYVFMTRMDDPGPVFTKIYRKLGIVNYWYVIGNNDIEFTSNLLIGQNGRKFEEDFFYNDSISVELDHDSQLLARGNEAPLAWKFQYGEGATIIYNGNNLFMKSNRGLIAGAISKLIPEYIYPIFNSKLFYIDDYPAPMSNSYDDKITEEYNRNISAFFKDIWWPNMITVAKNHNLKYTAVAIEDYNLEVTAPLPKYRQEDFTNLVIYGREVLKTGGEIGIHGYNHQPLQFREDIAKEYDYVTWTSYEDMEASIREVVAYIKRAFPNYKVVSYVPPSNILSEEGRKALVNNWEDLRVISSLYEDDPREFSYVQEFEISPDGILEMPRISSGYTESPDMAWLEVSAMTIHGFFSHFIHPDDMFDEHRSGDKGWSELYKDFNEMLKRLDTMYPWLRAQTSAEAAISVAATLNSEIERKYNGSSLSVSIDQYNVEQYFVLRTEKKIGKIEDCNVIKIDEHTYLVEATSEHFNIELK